jgi:hypothetical protein
VSASAQIAEQFPLFPIVTIDAMAVYGGKLFKQLSDNVLGTLAQFGIGNEDQLAFEFSRQILWLHIHFPHITHKRFVNHLILCFDNKHRYAQKMRALRMFQNNQLIAPTFWQLEHTFRSFANTIFKHLRPRIMIPTIDRFQFQWSPAEFGLQAADLFSHLTFNAIKHDLGIVNQNTSLKGRLLKQAVPTFSVDDALKAELQVTKNSKGEQEISCLNNKLRSRMQFLPA